MENKEHLDTLPVEKKRTWPRRLLRGALVCLAVLAAACIAFVGYTVATAPALDTGDVSPDGYRTTVLDDGGEEMVTLVGEASNRVYVTLDQIPEDLQNAFIAIEDERFWQHPGIDLRGIARAAWRNLTSGGLSEGASTITQQLIKNNVFAAGTAERTALDKIQRKIQEQYLALRLERQTSKEWILENYLNTINLGGGTWGVQTAAMRYFGKEVSELTLSECAVLAGITKSPNYYNPLKNPEASRERQELVLAKMLELGMISQEAYDAALADDVYGRLTETSTPGVTTHILSYFEDALVYEVLDDLVDRLGYTEEDAWRLLYRGGLTIYATQDSELQAICEEEINRDSWYSSDAQASVVVMDPATGQVKAIVGGRGEKDGSLTFNRAVSSVRQPGSVIKIVGEYAAALDTGAITLGTVIDDAPTTYSDGTAIRNASGKFGGMTTIRSGIANSTNVLALKCFQQTGMDTVWSYLEKFGLTHLTEEDKVEALALGGTHGGVTNLEMTAAYSAIANGGTYTEPTFYTKVLDREGNVLLENTPEQHTAVRSTTSALLTSAMEDVLTSGTGTRAWFSGMDLAGKSGTTTDLRDLWFVGYSPYYACGVWGGYDDFSAQSSSAYVKNIWKAVMQRAHQGLSRRDFTGTEELTPCTICTKCGALAVEDLCDSTVQGDMTYREYFVPGTEPTEACTCHVAVEVCQDSGQMAGTYCPADRVERSVYLQSGTAGTADAEAVVPEELGEETCQVHQHWWSWLFPEGGQDPQTPEEPTPEERPNGSRPGWGGWFNWW
ncbi:MAG: PBP1A family penicillin-binding protein [Dysosmobacter sp.]|nr:PBP1A family penicillin-binding protein [Dysosmobacter sp.]